LHCSCVRSGCSLHTASTLGRGFPGSCELLSLRDQVTVIRSLSARYCRVTNKLGIKCVLGTQKDLLFCPPQKHFKQFYFGRPVLNILCPIVCDSMDTCCLLYREVQTMLVLPAKLFLVHDLTPYNRRSELLPGITSSWLLHVCSVSK
jgi:hypothetical protein